MYTDPRTHEQFLHNSLILVKALHAVNLDMDIKVDDFILAALIDINIFIFTFYIVVLHKKLR